MGEGKKLLLGSRSPRRKELLQNLNLEFEVVEINTDESYPPHIAVREVAEFLSKKKADSYTRSNSDEILITADTIVVCEEEVFGKPKDRNEAMQMLSNLSEKTHEVITGVCVRSDKRTNSFSEITKVTFGNLPDFVIQYYVDRYKPFDKAGAYGIQEWIGMAGIVKIDGDYFNVVGLPVNRLFNLLIKEYDGKVFLKVNDR